MTTGAPPRSRRKAPQGARARAMRVLCAKKEAEKRDLEEEVEEEGKLELGE